MLSLFSILYCKIGLISPLSIILSIGKKWFFIIFRYLRSPIAFHYLNWDYKVFLYNFYYFFYLQFNLINFESTKIND